MTQFARPRSDVTNGGWSALGSTIPDNFWRLITEPVPNDSIGIRTGNNPAAVEFEAGLTVIGPPADSTDLTLRYRYLATNSGMDLTVRVLDGVTQVATFTHTTSPTSATEFTLSVPFAGITNWDDLRVEFTADGPGSCRVFNARLEAANDTGPGIVTELRALTPWALYRFREAAGAVANDELANAHMAAASGQAGGYVSRPTFAQTTMLPDGSDTSAALDGVDDEVESAGFTAYLGDGTIVLLLRAGTTASRAANETLFRSQSAGTAGLVALQWGASGQYVLHWRDDAASGTFTDLWTPAENDVDLIFIVTDGADLRVFRNDATASEFTTTAQTAQGHDEIAVGANKNSDALAEFDIQTLGVFRSALTEANRLDIHAALSAGGGTPGTASPATVAAVAAVPGPTVAGKASASPAAVAGVAAVPTPVARGSGQATPAAVAALSAVPSPSPAGAAAAAPAEVATVVAVPTPVIAAGGSATATPATVEAVATVPQVTVTSAGIVSVAVVAAVAAVPGPSPAGSAAVAPSTVVATVAVGAVVIVVSGSAGTAAPQVVAVVVAVPGVGVVVTDIAFSTRPFPAAGSIRPSGTRAGGRPGMRRAGRPRS